MKYLYDPDRDQLRLEPETWLDAIRCLLLRFLLPKSKWTGTNANP